MRHGLNVTIKISKIDLLIWAMFLTTFRPVLVPEYVRVGGGIALLFLVLLYLILHLPLIKLFNISLIYSLAVIASCVFNYVNGNLSLQNLMNGFQHALCLYCMYTVIQYCVQKGYKERMISALFSICLVYCILSFVSILMGGNGLAKVSYLFGTKFFTSYIFILFSGLYYLKYGENIKRNVNYSRVGFMTVIIFTLIVLLLINCSTALVAFIVFIGLCFTGSTVRRNLKRPFIFTFAVIGSMLILMALTDILQSGVAQYLVTTILHRNLTLTDRLRYYARAANVFEAGNSFWGYGYASDLMRNIIGLGSNIQNGLLQHLLTYGFVGLASFLLTIFMCLKRPVNSERTWGIYMMLYALVVAATVEVSYNTIFFLGIFLIKSLSDAEEKEEKL